MNDTADCIVPHAWLRHSGSKRGVAIVLSPSHPNKRSVPLLRRFPEKNFRYGHCLLPAGGGWRGERSGQWQGRCLAANRGRPPPASPRWGDVHAGKHRADTSGEPFPEITLATPTVLTPQ